MRRPWPWRPDPGRIVVLVVFAIATAALITHDQWDWLFQGG